jgi:hypothetical protein
MGGATVPTGLWRALALLAIAGTLALIVGDLVHPAPAGQFGLRIDPQSMVAHVDPDSSASRAGIVTGNSVRLAHDDFENRLNALALVVSDGTWLALLVRRGNVERPVTLVARPAHSRPLAESELIIFTFGLIRVVFLLVAAVIVLRRPERPDARALATFFVGFGGGSLEHWPWYPVPVAAALFVVQPVAVTFGLVQAVRFSTLFPRPSTRGLRRFIERSISWVAAPGVIAIGAMNAIPLWAGAARAGRLPDIASDVFAATLVVIFAALAAGLIIGTREADPADVPRLRWVAASMGVGLAGLVPIAILESLGIEPAFLLPLILLVGAIPLGTAYAILRHRMLDLGFVVNRALVFAAVSACVVALFILLEFVLGKYVATFGHVQSFVVEALAALAIGASLRGIHDRADAFVDNVIFRKRHQAERALRRMAHEAPYIDDPYVLAERVGAAQRHGEADSSAWYGRDGGGEFVLRRAAGEIAPAERIGRDDPAAVRARASGAPVDLEELATEVAPSAVTGALAFPMILRGELIGLLTCGGKRNGESYAPDERAVLAELAQAAGTALDRLQTVVLLHAVDEALSAGSLQPLRAARDAAS